MLDLTLFAVELLRYHFAENYWRLDVKLLQKLNDLVMVAWLVKKRPKSFDDVHDVVLVGFWVF